MTQQLEPPALTGGRTRVTREQRIALWRCLAFVALLQACLGIDLDVDKREVSLHAPRLPSFIDWIRIRHLQLGDARVDLILNRYQNNVGIDVLNREGDIAITVAV